MGASLRGFNTTCLANQDMNNMTFVNPGVFGERCCSCGSNTLHEDRFHKFVLFFAVELICQIANSICQNQEIVSVG